MEPSSPESAVRDLDVQVKARATAMQLGEAGVACLDSGVRTYGGYFRSPDRPFDATTRVSAACIAKFATSILLVDDLIAGKFKLDDRWAELLRNGLPAPAARSLGSITIHHLLEHTHGLDGSDVVAATFDRDGLIDLQDLIRRLTRRPPLAPPGAIYSYGHVGYLLLGALLERLHGATFASLLQSRLLGPLGIERPALTTGRICPSTAGTLSFSAKDVLTLLAHYLRKANADSTEARSLALKLTLDAWRPMPGWSWLDSGHALGWRHQSAGWMAWTGRGQTGDALAIRCHPGRDCGIVITGLDPRVFLLAEQLTHDFWGAPKRPNRSDLALESGRAKNLDSYVGRYADCTCAIDVEEGEASRLRMKVHRRVTSAAGEAGESTIELRTSAGGVCFSTTADPGGFHLVHFIDILGSGSATHIWNGMRVWPRVSNAPVPRVG